MFCRLAPFLKLYSTYTSGFEDAMKLLTEWTAREKKFDSLVRDFAVSGGREGREGKEGGRGRREGGEGGGGVRGRREGGKGGREEKEGGGRK